MGGFPGSLTGKESACKAGCSSLILGLQSCPEEGIGYPFQSSWASLWLRWQRIHWQCGKHVVIPGSGRSPGGGNCLPTPVSLPREFHGQRSPEGYSPWGHKELDMSEQLLLSLLSGLEGHCLFLTHFKCLRWLGTTGILESGNLSFIILGAHCMKG